MSVTFYKDVTKKELASIRAVEKYKSRPSPPYHAGDCKDKILEHNGASWLSKADTNNIYKWKKINYDVKTAAEYYKQVSTFKKKYNINAVVTKLNAISKKLLKHKIYLLSEIEWKNVGDLIDNAWDVAIDRMITITKSANTPIMREELYKKYSFMFYTNHRAFWSTLGSELYLQHNVLKKDADIVDNMFESYFGKSYSWNKKPSKCLFIKLPKL